MRSSSFLFALCLAPLSYLACDQVAEVGDVDEPAADGGSTDSGTVDPGTSSSSGTTPGPDASSDAAPTGAQPFQTAHPFVGCSGIGTAAADGRVLVAGTTGMAVLSSTGTLDPSFGGTGTVHPPNYENQFEFGFGLFALDGLGTGFYGVASARGPSNVAKNVFRYDLTGVQLSSFPGPVGGGGGGTAGSPESTRADQTGTLYLAYASAGQGAASKGMLRIDAAGTSSSWIQDSVGANGPVTVGPFESPMAVAHAGTDHYAQGVAKVDQEIVVHKLEANGDPSTGFTRFPAAADSRIRIGANVIYVVEQTPDVAPDERRSTRIAAFSRSTGAAIPTFTGGNGAAPGELFLPSPARVWGAVVDDQDRLYLLTGQELSRRLPTGAIDASFAPVTLPSILTLTEQTAAMGLDADRVYVTHCVNGTAPTQTTYAVPR